ncbi:MAG: 8-oxoguanine DNA glycosylase [Candidatus Thermoplasmatota archaeon]|nr:8-oxoguanine DNA glycosylase [Candidatus Thermoplasmatota archaeon]
MTYETTIAPLDLDLTLSCGQTFRWHKEGDSWKGILGRRLIILRTRGRTLEVRSEPDDGDAVALVREHVRADDDIPRIQRRLASDPVLARGMRDVRGLRIVKTDEWECLVSFVLATYANIPRITRMVETLCTMFGDEVTEGVHAFPDIRRLGQASEKELAGCGLGYRAKYVGALSSCLTGGDIRRMRRLPFEDLRSELVGLPGVGNKVADCVALFGFGRLEAFPIDVWMARALKRLYGVGGTYKALHEFASDRFGEYAGYAQEYLYYNERLCGPRGECLFSKERADAVVRQD